MRPEAYLDVADELASAGGRCALAIGRQPRVIEPTKGSDGAAVDEPVSVPVRSASSRCG